MVADGEGEWSAALSKNISLKSVPMDSKPAETASSTECATYLKALGDPVRLEIVERLLTGPQSVTHLAELMQMEIQNVSHHLRVLYHAKLVTIEKDGKFSFYRLNEDFLRARNSIKSLDFGCCKIDIRKPRQA